MSYAQLAHFYDSFNKGFDHRGYFESIREALSSRVSFPFGDCAALDCGCGTGSLTEEAVKAGFDCTGVDISPEMLAEASAKPILAASRLICQPLEEIDLYRAYDLVLCCLDTVNHLTDPMKLQSFFNRIYNFTEPGGFFVFDVKNEAEFRRLSGAYTFTDGDPESADGLLLTMSGRYRKPFMRTVLAPYIVGEGPLPRAEVAERFYSVKQIKAMMSETPYKYIGRYAWNRDERTVFIYRKEN